MAALSQPAQQAKAEAAKFAQQHPILSGAIKIVQYVPPRWSYSGPVFPDEPKSGGLNLASGGESSRRESVSKARRNLAFA